MSSVSVSLNLSKDDKKDQQIIIDAVQRVCDRGDIEVDDFWFETMFLAHKQRQNDGNATVTAETDTKSDEKEDIKDKTEQKQIKLSQIININNKEMCRYGHGNFQSQFLQDGKCSQCGSMEQRKYCLDCCLFDKDRTGKSYYAPFIPSHTYCAECRINNAQNIKHRIELDRFKAALIREELLKNPSLEMDILCNMPRRAALDTLIEDINKLEPQDRSEWCLFVFDLDFLKCWNTCLGHVKTDILIKEIGDIMKKYVKEINNGMWNKEEKGKLREAYAYRTGGDEFVMALRCGDYAYFCRLGPFYSEIRREINNLGSKIKELIFYENGVFNEKEWKEAKQKLSEAKDRKGQKVNMEKVGISTGIYVPKSGSSKSKKQKDWLEKADKMALETAKIVNAPNKNGVSIYYEGTEALIPNQKVQTCLEKGIYEGL